MKKPFEDSKKPVDNRVMDYLGIKATVKSPEEEADEAVRRIFDEIDKERATADNKHRK